MSTGFYFCDPQRSQYIDYLYKIWPKFQEQIKKQFHDLCQKGPAYKKSEEVEDWVLDELMPKISEYSVIPPVFDSDRSFGTTSTGIFRFHRWNGFHGWDDVEKHLKAHPDERIMDEYGKEYTSEELKKRFSPPTKNLNGDKNKKGKEAAASRKSKGNTSSGEKQ